MQVNLNNLSYVNFNATLKIYNSGNQNTKISPKSANIIEKAFSYATKDESGHMDVLLFDRYSNNVASPDRIIYTDGAYSDFADTLIKETKDNDVILGKLLTTFYGFKDIIRFKEKVMTMFK